MSSLSGAFLTGISCLIREWIGVGWVASGGVSCGCLTEADNPTAGRLS